jgi:DNA-directed RNA polymerase subunit M/transcription elongation factor TFIIS
MTTKRKKELAKKRVPIKVKNELSKKRGRPGGSKNKGTGTKLSTECDDYVPPKSYKFLGYCPKAGCGSMIGTNDLISKMVFVCPACDNKDKISKLKSKLKNIVEKSKSKKEYLSITIAHHVESEGEDIKENKDIGQEFISHEDDFEN